MRHYYDLFIEPATNGYIVNLRDNMCHEHIDKQCGRLLVADEAELAKLVKKLYVDAKKAVAKAEQST